jgi:DNA-directed RNA polymerase specialized sigma24 family protein
MAISNINRWQRACRVSTVIKQYIFLYRNCPESNPMAFDSILELLAAMIYRAVYHTLSKHQLPPWVTEDDLVQEGRLTLLLCLNKFNMENDEAVFIPYFRNALANNLRHYMLDATKKGLDPSLHSVPPEEEYDEETERHGRTAQQLITHPGAAVYTSLMNMLEDEFLADCALMGLYLGKSQEDIAVMLSQPVTKVAQGIATAKSLLKRRMA